MVQKINPHPAPGCNRSPPYYVFSKDTILGSVPSISSEVLAQFNNAPFIQSKSILGIFRWKAFLINVELRSLKSSLGIFKSIFRKSFKKSFHVWRQADLSNDATWMFLLSLIVRVHLLDLLNCCYCPPFYFIWIGLLGCLQVHISGLKSVNTLKIFFWKCLTKSSMF